MFRDIEEYIELAKRDIDVNSFIKQISENEKRKVPIMLGGGLFKSDFPIHVSLDYLPMAESVLPPALSGKLLAKKMFHNHDFFELTYIFKGQFEHYIEDEKFVHDKSAISLLNPFVLHKFVPVNYDDIAVNILMKESIIEELYILHAESDNKLYRFFFDSIYGNESKNYLILNNSDEVEGLILGIIDEYMFKKPFFHQTVMAKLSNLFAIIARNYPKDTSSSTRNKYPSHIRDILLYIRVRYASVTLDEVAKHFGYSCKYLSAMIKKNTGKNFSDIVFEYKLENACRYLTCSNIPIEKVNEIIGYKSVNNLYKVFIREFGLSPSEYRKQNYKYTAET